MANFGMGQAVRRTEDPRLLTGRGRYTDDIVLEGQLHAAFVRAPFSHAKITELDTAEAAEAPGVVAVLTAEDLDAMGIDPLKAYASVTNRDGSEMAHPKRPHLARETVRHVGEAVALVVAETVEQAKDAAELVMVDYDPLPSVTDMPAALAQDAPQIHDEAPGNLCFDWGMGDEAAVDAAFDQAAHIVRVDLVNNRVVPNPMEGRACLADVDPSNGRVTFYVSSQGAHGQRDKIAKDMLHIDPDTMRVITTDVGGGFGMKIFVYPEYVCTIAAAQKLGRPVKWTAERGEGFISDDHGRDHMSHVELALDADHRFTALRVDTLSNMGAYLSNFAPFVATKAGNRMVPGLYTLDHVAVRVRGVITNTQPVDAYRGAGRPEAAYLIERIVDKAARELGVSPVELRKQNYIQPDQFPFTTATGLVYDSGDFDRNLDDAMALADWDGFPDRRAEAEQRGKLRGIGLSTYVEACGGGGPENSSITIRKDGTARVTVGTQSNGQGHETAYKQVIAENLGLPLEAMEIVQGDTDAMATGSGTGGSRSIPVGGMAIADAALKVQEKARARAAELLEAAEADIEFADGRFTIVGTDKSMDLAEIAAQSAEEIAFREDGTFKPPENTYPNGAHVCELEVDPDTGGVDVIRYSVVDDFGTVLNPLMLEGQVHGGVAQGIGQALLERTVFDPDSGQLLTGSFMDYAMPRADNLPFVQFRYNVVPCKTNPLGVKGAGEAGAIGAPPAVINALVDALAPYGVDHIDMPATPEAVWQAIQAGRQPQAAE
jgi:carbon-monoxide dehydrogenase large subunit